MNNESASWAADYGFESCRWWRRRKSCKGLLQRWHVLSAEHFIVKCVYYAYRPREVNIKLVSQVGIVDVDIFILQLFTIGTMQLQGNSLSNHSIDNMIHFIKTIMYYQWLQYANLLYLRHWTIYVAGRSDLVILKSPSNKHNYTTPCIHLVTVRATDIRQKLSGEKHLWMLLFHLNHRINKLKSLYKDENYGLHGLLLTWLLFYRYFVTGSCSKITFKSRIIFNFRKVRTKTSRYHWRGNN